MSVEKTSLMDPSTALRYLRLCLGSQWSPPALSEALALSASAGFDWAVLRQCAWEEGSALAAALLAREAA